MVVLEGPLMTSPSGHQYLQPDYLSPLPTTLDAKKSPLALLAQTCSQIGADPPATTKTNSQSTTTSSTPGGLHSNQDRKKDNGSSPPVKPQPQLAFKPYENNVLTTKSPTSRRTPGRKSASPAAKDSGETSPVIRSGLEVMKDFKAPENPAFRAPPYPLYPGGWGYARVKTAGGGEALVPVCKDPYCGGCALSQAHPLAAAAAAAAASTPHAPTCPQGCLSCDSAKYLYSRPYVCSWISSDKYCGARFATSEDLLTHLRSHTADVARYPTGAAAPPPPPQSPSARYHPYSKVPAPAPFPFPSLYYPYLYQRLPAALHP